MVVTAGRQGLLRRRQHPDARQLVARAKVNFCKFTNETRSAIEDATAHSGQAWLAAVNGTAAGGGYELALACDEIILVDDALARCRCPRCRCSPCCPAPAGSPAWSTSARCAATGPTSSPRSRRASRASGRSSGGWSTRRAAKPLGRARPERAAGAGRARRPARRRPRASRSTPLEPARSRATASPTRTSPARSTAARGAGRDHGARARRRPSRRPRDELRAAGADSGCSRTARELDDLILHLRINEPEIGTGCCAPRATPPHVLARRRRARRRRGSLARARDRASTGSAR